MRPSLHLVPPTPPSRVHPRLAPVLLGLSIAVVSALPLLLTP